MVKKNYKYDQVKEHINEGDLILFRGLDFASKIISISTKTPYTHIGVASWINGRSNTKDGILECVEFSGGSILAGLLGIANDGGRSVNLNHVVEKHSGFIDIYRPNPKFFSYDFDIMNKRTILSEKKFHGKSVTDVMRKMTGLPYGWKRLLWMAKYKIFSYKLFGDYKNFVCDSLDEVVYPVCSTTIAHAFNCNGFDLVNNTSDQWTEPGDIAKSSQINYLFTLL